MPYPPQTDRSAIIETASLLIERDGIENLSLGGLAAELGIKAPSLYRHVASKNDLLRGVNENTYRKLFDVFDAVLQEASPNPNEQLRVLLGAYRAFAHAHPNTYILAYTTIDPDLRPDPDALVRLVLPIQAIMARVTGPENSLPALRGALALVHGFAMLELMDQLQRGGDLNAAFEASIDAYLRGWKAG